MNRAGPIVVAVLALSGCSAEPAPADRRADAPVQPAATPAPLPPPRAAGGLTGQVSGLAGSVSGLNTRVTDMGLVIDLPADALFAFDKAELTPEAEAQLLKAAELIRRSPPGAIRVIGHTDSKGDDAYNQRLSEARARTVADWFAGQVGVRTRAVDVAGRGEAEPIAPNQLPGGGDDPAGRARNRRVEVIIPRMPG